MNWARRRLPRASAGEPVAVAVLSGPAPFLAFLLLLRGHRYPDLRRALDLTRRDPCDDALGALRLACDDDLTAGKDRKTAAVHARRAGHGTLRDDAAARAPGGRRQERTDDGLARDACADQAPLDRARHHDLLPSRSHRLEAGLSGRVHDDRRDDVLWARPG